MDPLRSRQHLPMAVHRTTNIFSILIGFVIFGLIFYILKAEIDKSLEIMFSAYKSEYKSIVSLLLLLMIMLVLLLLAITCTYSRFLQMLGVSEQVEVQRNQIFFNLIQLSIDNFAENSEDGQSDPIYEPNPPDYSSCMVVGPERTNKSESDSSCRNSLEPPPSYEEALNRSQQRSASVSSECCLTSCQSS